MTGRCDRVETVDADGREWVSPGRCGHYLKPHSLGLMPPSLMKTLSLSRSWLVKEAI